MKAVANDSLKQNMLRGVNRAAHIPKWNSTIISLINKQVFCRTSHKTTPHVAIDVWLTQVTCGV